MESIIVALITGGSAFLGVVFTNVYSNNKAQAQMEKAQAVTDTKLDELTREVREHNHFAKRMPALEAKLDATIQRIDKIEEAHKGKV